MNCSDTPKSRLIICPQHNTALWTCTTTPSSLCARWGLSCGNIFTLNRKNSVSTNSTLDNSILQRKTPLHQAVIMCIQDIPPPNYLCAGGVSQNIMVLKAWVHLINPNCIDHKPFFFNKKVHNPWRSSYII